MASTSIAPKLDPEEAAVLEQLSKVEAAVRARPTPRVVQAVRELAEHAEREFAESRRRMREALDRIHASNEASGLPVLTADEIDEEIRAARTQRHPISGQR